MQVYEFYFREGAKVQGDASAKADDEQEAKKIIIEQMALRRATVTEDDLIPKSPNQS